MYAALDYDLRSALRTYVEAYDMRAEQRPSYAAALRAPAAEFAAVLLQVGIDIHTALYAARSRFLSLMISRARRYRERAV